ncbi:FUN14 domain-containing protein 1 [Mortierella alpina]|nr:FUN14 domain-containing protein 1 [Mortierella alpina]
MLVTTLHTLRPAALLRSTFRSLPTTAAPCAFTRQSPKSLPAAFLRQQRFASSASASHLASVPGRSSILRSNAIKTAFKRAGSGMAATSSRTLIGAGAATTCIFGPLIYSRSAVGLGLASTSSSRYMAYCAPAIPIGVRSNTSYDAYGYQKEPLINTKELTFGMAMGLCSGFLFKKLGKMMMLVVGLGFVSLQMLTSSGYVQVNWALIERRFKDQFDVDGDGKVTMNDAKHGFRWLMELLTRNFQFKSTFVGGFVLGFRYG